MPGWVELLVQVVVAAALGAAVGFERELSAQPAGLRTHMLVSLGAALFTIAGAEVLGADPARVAAQVVTGIGFLGAGAILQQGVSVRGLTTAASLWVTAAIGTAAGIGYLAGAAITTGIVLVSLVILKQLEKILLERFKRGHVRIVVDGTEEFRIVGLVKAVDEFGGRIESIKHVDEATEGHRFVVVARLPSPGVVAGLVAEIRELHGVQNVDRSA